MGFGRARSVIVVFASGGQSQIDLWDPKPLAPAEIRGDFASIETAVPGVRFCEHVPRIAAVADRFTVLRSMSHEDLDHGSAVHLALTGRYHRQRTSNPPPSPEDPPCYSSVLKRVRPSREFLHTAIHLNGPNLVPSTPAPGQFGGLLGKKYDAFTLGDVSLGDVSAGEVVVPELDPLPEMPAVRLRSRETLLGALDRFERRAEQAGVLSDSSGLYDQAFRMLAEPRMRDAFQLSAEPESLRDRYGRNRSGQACLLARRLVEAGAPLVTVFWNHSNRGQDTAFDEIDEWGWDTHNDIFYGLRQQLLPRFDQGFSALIEDLDERGLLDETLVLCMGEFGRAPRVALEPRFAGATPGRKHWSSVYSIAAAGAGVKRGGVVGASDEQGAYPAGERYAPWDVIATIFSALGIDPHGKYFTPLGQELHISDGRPIEPLYSA
ncbi:MAG: DUF1501 domain-containing protein [Planctomycetota bacterium]|nr:MAG: DUF1501 domain-containing protein [Planctomycetota bacterium]